MYGQVCWWAILIRQDFFIMLQERNSFTMLNPLTGERDVCIMVL